MRKSTSLILSYILIVMLFISFIGCKSKSSETFGVTYTQGTGAGVSSGDTTLAPSNSTKESSNDYLSDETLSSVTRRSVAFNEGVGIQGKDLWFYQQWDGTNYSNMIWNNTNNKWQGSENYLSVSDKVMDPGLNSDAVLKWVAPSDGSVRVKGNVKKSNIESGDGVAVKILHNSTNIWGVHNIDFDDKTGLVHDIERKVEAGDSIYFHVSSKSTNNNDETFWDPTIEFTPVVDGASIIEWNYKTGKDGWSADNNCTVSANSDFLSVMVTGSTPGIISPNNSNIDITKNSIIKIRYKNNTDSDTAVIYFTTNEDTKFTQAKSKNFTVKVNDPDYTVYTIDMSGVYGWLGKLKQIRIVPTNSSTGSCSIDYIKLQAGGSKAPPFSLLEKEIVYNKANIESMGLDRFADSMLGVIRNDDASYNFFTSSGGAPDKQNSTVTLGTLDDPANTVVTKWQIISGTPSDFGYASIGPVYQDPSDPSIIMSFIHLERKYEIGDKKLMDASIGIAISKDKGSTWTYCGEIVDHNLTYDPTRVYGLEIGGGEYIIYNDNGTDYFYVYIRDFSISNPYWPAMSVSRAPVASVLEAAKKNTVTKWHKYYNGEWTEPGMNGRFTNIIPDTTKMNWMSISYNSYLDKYLLAYTSTRQWGSDNWSDISLLISDSPIDFINNTSEHLIDASSKYEQYPTIIGLGNSNPQLETQKNFYIYYMQWANDRIWWSGEINLVRRMVVLD